MTPTLIAVILLALIFDFTNGIRDSSNIVATMITSRAFPPRVALGVTAVAEFSGPLLVGVALAKTIGEGIVSPKVVNLQVILAALVSAIIWNLITWFSGLPSSSSHALIGGIIGAVVIGTGWQEIKIGGLEVVLIALFASPIIGFIAGLLFTKLIYLLCLRSTPRVNLVFKRGQIFTAIALALSHGANDAQKTMGIITMALVTGGYLATFEVPIWVILLCSAVIAIGTSIGGWRLIRTLGAKFYKIRPVHALSSQLASASVILGSSILGGPVSTTQIVSSAIMGVGSAERLSKVRWGVAGEILAAWVLTIPVTVVIAGGLYWIIHRIFA